MRTLQIEVDDDIYTMLEHLASENETDPMTLLRVQIEQLVATYRGPGLTQSLPTHLAASIQQHRPLLKRLAE